MKDKSPEVFPDVDPADLLTAVSNQCLPADADETGRAQPMVGLLMDGLRYGAAGQSLGKAS